MENCSTKPVCQSTAHQDCQANAVQPMNFKFIHICYLNEHNLFGTKGVKHTEGFCDLHACMVLFLGFFSGILCSLEFKTASVWTSM